MFLCLGTAELHVAGVLVSCKRNQGAGERMARGRDDHPCAGVTVWPEHEPQDTNVLPKRAFSNMCAASGIGFAGVAPLVDAMNATTWRPKMPPTLQVVSFGRVRTWHGGATPEGRSRWDGGSGYPVWQHVHGTERHGRSGALIARILSTAVSCTSTRTVTAKREAAAKSSKPVRQDPMLRFG